MLANGVVGLIPSVTYDLCLNVTTSDDPHTTIHKLAVKNVEISGIQLPVHHTIHADDRQRTYIYVYMNQHTEGHRLTELDFSC